MTNLTKVTATYFISSGAKNAMYTLRVERRGGGFTSDNYICNLSTDPDKAEEKAREYFDRMVDRLNQTDTFQMVFQGFADFDLFERRGKLSVQDTENLELLEQGIMPIGKRKGEVIADMPMYTILWWADQCKENGNDSPVFQAICAYCMGVALDKDYIAKREEIRAEWEAERQAKIAAAQYIGEIGKRMEMSGTVEKVISLGYTQVSYYTEVERFMTKINVDGNVVIYYGNKIVEEGDVIRFKATPKLHNEYKEVKQTIVQRVKVLE
ncbi:MAG: hypothetical protein [Enterobacter phage ENC7]|nr:MAG: hypothetical protein [Enterobacter phage ENC7]UIW11929.1 MAG: hypothetical protein [Enterobacter phage ENC25]UIW12187.1 MAG: hypothetical protein [Enterobacter phage ENC22]